MKKSILCLSMLCLFVGFILASPRQAYQAATMETTLYGCIASGKKPVGIYSTTTGNPPTIQNLKQIQGFIPTAGVYANGNYFLFTKMEMGGQVVACNMEQYDPATWNVINNGFPGNDIVPTSLAYNTKDSKTYGCFPNNTKGFDFCTLDLTSCKKTKIATLSQQFVAIFTDNQGYVYGIGLDGNLHSFDVATGSSNLIGSTGITPTKDVQDACFDEGTGKVYWFARTATESALYTVDTTSGKATKVTTFENSQISWCGMFSQPKPTEITLLGSISSGKKPIGIYSTTTGNPPTIQNLKQIQGFIPTAGVYANGNYFLFTKMEMGGQVVACNMEQYDPATWNVINNGFPGNDIVPTSLAYNTKDSKTYGCFPNNTKGFDFCTLDLTSCKKTKIATLSQQFVAIFTDNQGYVYGIGLDGNLHSFDVATGSSNLIGATGITPTKDAQDACFDEETGKAYWFARTATESALYTVDTTSGKATKVTTFENSQISWCGVFVQPKQKALKPAYITEMRTDFVKSSLNGNFIFRLPNKSENGEPLSGTLSYKAYLDDVEFNTGENKAGTEITIPVTIEEEGKHKFSVYASQNGLDGQITYIENFIGQDTPKAPANFKAAKVANSNDVNITWDAVTKGVNSGYINLEAIRYNLIRQPNNVILGTNLTSTSFTDKTIKSMNNYSYIITATDGVKTSEMVISDTLLVAENIGIIPPYEYSFLDGKGFGFFTTIDANNDGKTWIHNDKNVFYYTNKDKAADDWLISPKFRLEKGKHYNLSMILMVSDINKVEKFEIKYGTEANSNAMTNTICPVQSTSKSYTVDEWITPTETGVYYIGIHAISEKAQGALGIMNFNITSGVAQESPSTATDITITAGAKGELNSEISFTCPTINFGKAPLTDLTKVVVTNMSTGTVVASETNIKPGQKVNVADHNPQAGMNKYSIVCHNNAGAGIAAIEECWIGLDAPASPLKANWIQKGSQTIITWEAPSIGKHGGYIDPTKLTYSIYNTELQVEVKSGLKECTYTDVPQIKGLQSSLLYQIYANNECGTSEPTYSNYSAFGIGYECPFKESFKDKKIQTTPWIIKPISGNNVWQLVSKIEQSTIAPQDNDKGMIAYSAVNQGSAQLESPIIDITGQNKPALKLWYYMLDKATDLKIKISNDCGTSWTKIVTLPNEVLKQWTIATVDLTNYKSYEHLQIAIEAANTLPGNPVFVDNITIENSFDYDLQIQKLNIPELTQAGTTLNASVLVVNNGYKTIDRYQLEYYVNDELISSFDGKQLAADGLENFKLAIPVSINSAEELEIKCKVVCSNDENVSNNEAIQLAPITISKYPKPSNLKANISQDNQIALTWTAPTTEYIPEYTDDLESYEAWTVGGIDVVENRDTHEMIVKQDRGTIGDYSLIDNDHQPTQFIMGAWGKPIPHLGDGMVCQVIDIALYDNSNSSIMAAHSGNKMFCFWTSPQNDDYFILPELAPNSKYISFWAKSLSDKYGLESFDIMISTTGKEIADFTLHTAIEEVPVGYKTDPEAGYTFYEFNLPEDTKYVAIHYRSKDVLALLVDDITCTPVNKKMNLTIDGYNIYRNGVKINKTLVKETNFADQPMNSDMYRYNVTTVFKEGESRYSNTAEITFTSDIDKTNFEKGLIYTTDNAILIDGLEGKEITIHAVDGRLLKQIKAEPSTRISIHKGIYLVKTPNYTQKVVVK